MHVFSSNFPPIVLLCLPIIQMSGVMSALLYVQSGLSCPGMCTWLGLLHFMDFFFFSFL